MTAVVRGRAALAAGQVTDGLVRDLCDEIDRLQQPSLDLSSSL